MEETDAIKPSSPNSAPRLAVFLHATGTSAPDASWVERLASRGIAVFSHRELEGVQKTAATRNALGALCVEIQEQAPGSDLLILRHPLAPDLETLEALGALLEQAPGVGVYTTFSNADPACNPYAGLDCGHTDPDVRQRLVRLLGSGRLLPLSSWPDHLLALTSSAVQALADPALDWADAAGRLRTRLVQAELADWLYVEAADRKPDQALRLDPHEERRPTPWGRLSERLPEWLAALESDPTLAKRLPDAVTGPVTLHITHSWGGGVATWVASMIDGDERGLHFQLRSEGPQTGQGAGQRLGLYLGNHLDTPVDRWWLQPAIRAVDTAHAQYREVLDALLPRLGVGRVIVSSLVGHSLDALRTELPTVQVLHDAFPAWPLLSIHPDEYDGDLERALDDPRAGEQFPELVLEDWRRITEQFDEAARDIDRVAPSRSALAVQANVDPGLAPDHAHLIPHGLPPLPRRPVRPAGRPDGRLNIVIPGRVQSGKGAVLLEAALPGLRDVAQVTLLGTGKGGERFFGCGGVNVVLQYDRETLADLLNDIGPHCAILPSLVPETFSYTLSEMQALGVPVIATRLGSFAERIDDGETGWLIEPTAQALVDRVTALAQDPGLLDGVRARLADHEPRTLAEMVADYDDLCPAQPRTPRRPAQSGARLGLAEAQAVSSADQLHRARAKLVAAGRRSRELEALVEERTRWAQDEERRRKEEEHRRRTWVTSLEQELADLRAQRDEVMAQVETQDRELAERAAHIRTLDEAITGLEGSLAAASDSVRELEVRTGNLEQARDELQASLDQVLSSHSWKITMPLRVSRRVVSNFFHLRAWNPLRWPLLLSQTVRNLATVGVGGTLRRMQRFEPDHAPVTTERSEATVAAPQTVDLPDSVPCSDTPAVSVVIPAYNHLDHTAACLASIAAASVTTPYEVIVVDDASADDTADRLPEVDGLRFLRNEENQGFIRTCNRGAEAARGEFVLFLNNDTQVGDGWLDALLDTFGTRPDAGLVGAKLVYPDGTLQECGGMVFRDGSGWNYGRGDDPDRPEYQYLREVDYCSGACITLRRDLFDRLGGFDTHYAPAYYEDTDLAFKVREAGLKVYVQPRATITHFEGVSSGTDLGSGTKRYQVVNHEKFRERWADALAHQPAPIENPGDLAAVRAARDHRLAGRVLVVDAYTPEPDQDSGSVRLVNLMRCLQDLGYGVTFFADNRAWNGRYTRDLQDLGVEAWYDPWLRSAEALLERQGPDYGHVIVSRHYVATNYVSLVRRLAPRAKFIFDTVDLHFLREQRLAELEDSTALRQVAKQTRRSELAMIRASDATLVVSPVERELLAEEVPDAAVFILSNIHEVSGSAAGFTERSDLYFVGGYQHPPNIDAARWFVEDIWPGIRERLPEARFHLVGSKATDAVRALGDAEGVTFHGFVESLAPFLDRCRLSVAPLRYGAGVKGKVNQAMAHGQPVVATPAAVEGIHATDGEDVLIASEADAFADAVVRLYEDEALWNRLSENGLTNVRAHFSRDAAKRDLETLFEALARND